VSTVAEGNHDLGEKDSAASVRALATCVGLCMHHVSVDAHFNPYARSMKHHPPPCDCAGALVEQGLVKLIDFLGSSFDSVVVNGSEVRSSLQSLSRSASVAPHQSHTSAIFTVPWPYTGHASTCCCVSRRFALTTTASWWTPCAGSRAKEVTPPQQSEEVAPQQPDAARWAARTTRARGPTCPATTVEGF
jgi:hypothetical protein